jgi:hypothetical protein
MINYKSLLRNDATTLILNLLKEVPIGLEITNTSTRYKKLELTQVGMDWQDG